MNLPYLYTVAHRFASLIQDGETLGGVFGIETGKQGVDPGWRIRCNRNIINIDNQFTWSPEIGWIAITTWLAILLGHHHPIAVIGLIKDLI
jgi:hypothetical protein